MFGGVERPEVELPVRGCPGGLGLVGGRQLLLHHVQAGVDRVVKAELLESGAVGGSHWTYDVTCSGLAQRI